MDLTGCKLGKYHLRECIGHGGMATVYRAFQPSIKRDVAIKVMHVHLTDSQTFVARFCREACRVGQLHHPNIIRVIDADMDGNTYYTVMDYIAGGTLQDYLQSAKSLSLYEALGLTEQLADALAYTHEQGIIHRDIKPANIMFADATHKLPMLTDFGFARLLEDETMEVTVAGTVLGTPNYISPEAVRGETCDGRADIYSLGTILYEIIAGRTPYVADTPYSLMMMQVNDPLPPIRDFMPDIPTAVEELLVKALAKDLNNRYQNAADFAHDLRLTQATMVVEQKKPAPAPAVSPPAVPVSPVPVSSAQVPPISDRQAAPKSAPTRRKPWSPARIRTLSLAGVGLSILLIAALTSLALLTWDNSAGRVRAHTSISTAGQRNGNRLPVAVGVDLSGGTTPLPGMSPAPVETATQGMLTAILEEPTTDATNDSPVAPSWPTVVPAPTAETLALLPPTLSGLEPANHAVSQELITFTWPTVSASKPDQRLELAFWPDEPPPWPDGISVAVPTEDQSLTVNLHQLNTFFSDSFDPGEHNWELLLVRVKPKAKRLKHLGGGNMFILE